MNLLMENIKFECYHMAFENFVEGKLLENPVVVMSEGYALLMFDEITADLKQFVDEGNLEILKEDQEMRWHAKPVKYDDRIFSLIYHFKLEKRREISIQRYFELYQGGKQ